MVAQYVMIGTSIVLLILAIRNAILAHQSAKKTDELIKEIRKLL